MALFESSFINQRYSVKTKSHCPLKRSFIILSQYDEYKIKYYLRGYTIIMYSGSAVL